MGFSLSPNTGKLLENLVFLALRRQTPEIYYYTVPAGFEVDFYLPETREVIQVGQNLAQPVGESCGRDPRASGAVGSGAAPRKRRTPTRPSAAARERRLAEKRTRSAHKQMRRKVGNEE